ncbi:MAG: DUF4338 domain-containing protein, partial [Rhodanobacter sp.]
GGGIELPSPCPVSFAPAEEAEEADVAMVSIEAPLAALGTVELVEVANRTQSRTWRALMQHHPLGAGPLCGAQRRYLVRSRAGWLGALSFSAPARRLAARDGFIGWDDAIRRAQLPLVINNSRFLIVPSVKVAHLASHVLSLAERRLADDWHTRYGVRPVLLETFVDSARHQDTCYRTANWIALRHTCGRGRQDRHRQAQGSPKHIFVRSLLRNWRNHLVDAAPPVAPAPAPAIAMDWAEQEFGPARLPDARLQRRLLTVARDFYARPCANVPQACGTRANQGSLSVL